MADVERRWFRRVMAQADAPPLYWSEDVPDADWLGAVADPAVVDDAWRSWRDEVAFAENACPARGGRGYAARMLPFSPHMPVPGGPVSRAGERSGWAVYYLLWW
jgi:hypothetical protein